MRIDRVFTLAMAAALSNKKSYTSRRSMAILMYHSISGSQKDEGYYGLTTSVGLFETQMEYLSRSGYSVVSLADGVRSMLSPARGHDKLIVLTFDDGFLDFFTEAYPIIKKHNFPATVFLPVLHIENHQTRIRNTEHMRWEHVKELAAEGIHFGSHSYAHPQLRGMEWSKIDRELQCSKEAIERHTGREVDAFSYPFALPGADRSFISMFQSRLAAHGYRYGVTTRIGTSDASDNRFFLRRLPINSGDDMPLFAAKLRGAYNWVALAQSVVKRLKTFPPDAGIQEAGAYVG